MKKIKKIYTDKLMRFSWRRIWVFVISVAVIVGIIFFGTVLYARGYDGKVIPGITIGNIPIGGMTEQQLKTFLQDMSDKLLNEGVGLEIETEKGVKRTTLYPVIVTEDKTIELLYIDVEKEVERLLQLGKAQDIFTRAVVILRSRINGKEETISHITLDKEVISDMLQSYIEPFETQPKDAEIIIESVQPFSYDITEEVVGNTYDYANVFHVLHRDWSRLQVPTLSAFVKTVEVPEITKQDIESIVDRLDDVFNAGSIVLTYTHPQTASVEKWTISITHIAKWLTLFKDEENVLVFHLDKELVENYIKEHIAKTIDVPAVDAKFSIGDDGRVREFQTSRPGVRVDVEKTYDVINNVFMQRTWHDEGVAKSVQIITTHTEPLVRTTEVNDLGIAEKLGSGSSSYAGSPKNRRRNIQNAVEKLHGILLAPGEEFSTIEHTQPYTVEGGYLPELVIKGDELKPEIGGGLCQIGTTLFRMAMMSGLEITERRNHSLVVGYYNDRSNGLPGTDATIYEPRPDFKFKNDTTHHILIQTYNDTKKQELVFTVWGTRIVETTKLAPGEKECQHAFRGADAHFTYTRTLLGQETEERLFESHYRPLPEICLLGIDPEEEIVEERDLSDAFGDTQDQEGVTENIHVVKVTEEEEKIEKEEGIVE